MKVWAILSISLASFLNLHPLREPQGRNDSLVIEFVRIPAGRMLMGSINSGQTHQVRINRSFELGKYEISQAQWTMVRGNNPSCFKGSDRPVECVSWNDVQRFIQNLNARNDGYLYRLPTEEEWEYACRAEAKGSPVKKLDAMSWHKGNSEGKTHPIGQKEPNAWGVYDMLGNVREWCQDRHSDSPNVVRTRFDKVELAHLF